MTTAVADQLQAATDETAAIFARAADAPDAHPSRASARFTRWLRLALAAAETTHCPHVQPSPRPVVAVFTRPRASARRLPAVLRLRPCQGCRPTLRLLRPARPRGPGVDGARVRARRRAVVTGAVRALRRPRRRAPGDPRRPVVTPDVVSPSPWTSRPARVPGRCRWCGALAGVEVAWPGGSTALCGPCAEAVGLTQPGEGSDRE